MISGKMYRFRGDERLISSKFLACFLRSPGARDEIEGMKTGISESGLNLTHERFSHLMVPLPPLPEQHRIAEKIESLFARSARARAHLAQIPRLIERYRQAVLEAAFRGDLTANWRTDQQPCSPANEFVSERQDVARNLIGVSGVARDVKSAMLLPDSDLNQELEQKLTDGALPPSWVWTSVGQVFGVYVGATPSRKSPSYWGGDVPWVSSGEVAFTRISETFEKITKEGLANASTRLHPAGTVLLGMIGEGKTRGQAAILDIPACNNQNCAAVRVSETGYPPEYLYWYFFRAYEETRTIGSGNGQQALNKDRVQRLPIPLAPVAEAAKIVRLIDERMRPLELIEREVHRALALSGKLESCVLDKAFTGELVPQDPTDEPAAELLARIKAARAEAPATRGRRRKA
jgi:type I restriction enzyme S subunit